MPLTSLNTEVLAYLLISIDFESDFFPVCSFLVPDIPPQDFKASFFMIHHLSKFVHTRKYFSDLNWPVRKMHKLNVFVDFNFLIIWTKI